MTTGDNEGSTRYTMFDNAGCNGASPSVAAGGCVKGGVHEPTHVADAPGLSQQHLILLHSGAKLGKVICSCLL
jgi:hypothetical protein